ncbi:hypothetical protein M422DRAFT_51452 [Sphaerobolus stellatus SS14]|uniref:Uncharacterized protein n=1 Tax=Sphaerobolus stellatus (strain SS14) TaxID=990650 RepID=A0A0C9TYM5_SPHS4|nr:hypothetical protein M422DRAFT_51452 [Sphaerobolus stellatus SS14]
MFVLTFGRTIYLKHCYRSSTPLMEVILRDGGLYFMALLMVNSVGLILVRPSIVPATMHLSAVLTCILVSRLFLNLRLVAYRSERFHTKPEDITCSLGIWRIPGSTFNSSAETRKTLHWLLPDLSSYTEFHVSLLGFDTYLLHEEEPENTGDEYHGTSNPAEWHV